MITAIILAIPFVALFLVWREIRNAKRKCGGLE